MVVVSCDISFFVASSSIYISHLYVRYFILSGILFHSAMVTLSCDISFLEFISIEFSFLHGNYFILPGILSPPPLAAISFLLAFISIIF